MRFLLGIVLLLVSCAGAPAEKAALPAAPPSPCETIATTYCTKGEVCGAWRYSDCSSELLPACVTVVGISAEEAGACARAIVAASCRSSMPIECLAIADRGPAPPLSSPEKSLSL